MADPNSNYLTTITGLVDRLVSAVAPSPFNLKRLDNFPFTEWSAMQDHYKPLIDWYEGIPLQEKLVDTKTGTTIDKFPIKLNPIPGTCEKHTAVLLGNTLESIRDGGLPIQFIPKADVKEEHVPIIEKAIMDAFGKTGGGAQFVDAGITSQYLGGCVWKVRWDGDDDLFPVQADVIDPVEFLAIPKSTNFWSLHEAWFVREVSLRDAEAFGYKWNQMDEKFYYVEHWTEKKLKVYLNDVTIKDEDNKFGIVPFVYIPHIRVRNFIGKSIITEAVRGIVKEWNLRFADVGDAVSDDAHPIIANRGVRGNLSQALLPDGRKTVSLGSKSGIGPNETEPDLFSVKTQITSEPMIRANAMLEGQYRKETKHPAVADGEDEGSQRSAATLTVRMWPLISHVELERINWTTGLLKLVEIILAFYSIGKVGGITPEMAKSGFTVKWSSPLPRDREALINELAIRKKNKMTSTRHILELLGDIQDVEKELELIEDEQTREFEAQMKMKESNIPDAEGKGNAEGKNNQEPGDETNPDAKNQIESE